MFKTLIDLPYELSTSSPVTPPELSRHGLSSLRQLRVRECSFRALPAGSECEMPDAAVAALHRPARDGPLGTKEIFTFLWHDELLVPNQRVPRGGSTVKCLEGVKYQSCQVPPLHSLNKANVNIICLGRFPLDVCVACQPKMVESERGARNAQKCPFRWKASEVSIKLDVIICRNNPSSLLWQICLYVVSVATSMATEILQRKSFRKGERSVYYCVVRGRWGFPSGLVDTELLTFLWPQWRQTIRRLWAVPQRPDAQSLTVSFSVL